MLASLPQTAIEFKDWSWAQIEPYFQDLEARRLNESSVRAWLADWSQLGNLLDEAYWRLYVAITVDTTDEIAERKYNHFLDEIRPRHKAEEQKLKEKLLSSGLEPAGFEIALRNMKAEADLFRRENLPLLSEDKKLSAEYDKIIGAQTVEWEGREVTLSQLQPVYAERDRERRERAWRLGAARWLEDREAINELWAKFLGVRRQLADNAGLENYRTYRWRERLRFDYSPQDCYRFHQAIEEAVVPAALSLLEKRREALGVPSLRPWDLEVDQFSGPSLKPFKDISDLVEGTAAMFHKVDPQLGEYFETMRREELLDLDNRKGKAPGGYCTDFKAAGLPFIFMNSVGINDDVQTLLHEGGHAFHAFESRHLLYHYREVLLEFAEVASMSMEYLAAPYLESDQGGFYNPRDAARARIEHLDVSLRFWPYMAVVDAFQHWVYDNPEAAVDPENCDSRWAELWDRFMPGVDWSGLEQEKRTGWHRKLHIHQEPFYYVEYGLAQLGAVQVWRNALGDQAGAVAAYRKALKLGSNGTLPQLYAAAGAKFAFDAGTLNLAVDLMVKTIEDLEAKVR
jgi:oligoendopeptidase F